jgi:hypothetical protein
LSCPQYQSIDYLSDGCGTAILGGHSDYTFMVKGFLQTRVKNRKHHRRGCSNMQVMLSSSIQWKGSSKKCLCRSRSFYQSGMVDKLVEYRVDIKHRDRRILGHVAGDRAKYDFSQWRSSAGCHDHHIDPRLFNIFDKRGFRLAL